MFPKTKRIVDEELLEAVRNLRCLCCLRTPCDPHHVSTRGSGGDDTPENVMPLCSEHHRMWHDKGPAYMIENFGAVKTWLKIAGREDVLERAQSRQTCGNSNTG